MSIDLAALKAAAGRAKPDPSEPIQWFRYRDLRFIFKGRSPAIDIPTCDFIVMCSPHAALALITEIEALSAERDKVRREAFADGMEYASRHYEFDDGDVTYTGVFSNQVRSGAVPIPGAPPLRRERKGG